MIQDVTYWALIGKNEFNESLFDNPVVLKCRWEDKAVLFRDSNGQEVVSSAVIYPAYKLELKGYIKRGISAELIPIGLSGAFEIRFSGDSPNLRATETLNKVMV
jgi:hypothetical protein